MVISNVQQSAFQRNVSPARGTDQRKEQGNDLEQQLRQAEKAERATRQEPARQQQEATTLLERRFDGRLVRVGGRDDIEDSDQARAELMRQKLSQAYRASPEPVSTPVVEYAADEAAASSAEMENVSARRSYDNIDLVV